MNATIAAYWGKITTEHTRCFNKDNVTILIVSTATIQKL